MNQWKRLFLPVCSGLWGVALAAGPDTPPKDEVYELPPFTVEGKADLPPREKWRYGAIAGLEILSNASDRATQEWVKQIETARQVGEYVWPVKPASSRCNVFILCKSTKSGEVFLNPARLAGYKSRPPSPYMAMASDWEHSVGIGNAGSLPRFKDWTWRHQLYSSLLIQTEPRPPSWMSRTAWRILQSATLDGDELRFGGVDMDLRIVEMQSSLSHVAGSVRPPPPRPSLAEVFNFDPATAYQHPIKNFMGVERTFLIFSYLCLVGRPDRYEAGFVHFINRARIESVTPQLFEDCFGQTIAELDKAIQGYYDEIIWMGNVPRKIVKGVKLRYEPLELRDATDAEVGRIKGEALAMLSNSKPIARQTLRAPYVRGERDPQLLAAIGLYERKHGNKMEASQFLEAAVREKVDRPRAYIELARMRYQEGRKKPAGSDELLNAAQLQPVMDLLESARALPAKIPETYDLIAETCAQAEPTAMRRYLTLIDEGVTMFPFHAELICQSAAAFARAGRPQEAAKLIAYGLKAFRYHEPAYCERLQKLQISLTPDKLTAEAEK